MAMCGCLCAGQSLRRQHLSYTVVDVRELTLDNSAGLAARWRAPQARLQVVDEPATSADGQQASASHASALGTWHQVLAYEQWMLAGGAADLSRQETLRGPTGHARKLAITKWACRVDTPNLERK